MKELIAKLKYERDRLYTLWCSGSRRQVESLVRGKEITTVINEAMTALASMPAWVKCEDRMPEKGRIVRVAMPDGDETFAIWEGGTSWEDAVCYTQEYDDVIFDKLEQPPAMWFDLPAPPIQQEG